MGVFGLITSSMQRTSKTYSHEGLVSAGRVLAKNPEVYSLWAYRRECIDYFNSKPSDIDVPVLYMEELRLTAHCLAKAPKSYWVWDHRRWAVLRCVWWW
jgi:geranylgeranyl transferase type-2 subunit alpha